MVFNLLIFSIFNFGVYVFSALAFFAGGLLFLDAWKLDKKKQTYLVRAIGFFIMAIVFALNASSIKSPPILGLSEALKVLSFGLIFLSIFKEPILRKPVEKVTAIIPVGISSIYNFLTPLSAVLSTLISFWFLKHSTKGLEKQVKPAFLAFLFISLSEYVRITFIWQKTTNVFWSKLLQEYGALWSLHMVLLLIGIGILAYWLWGYIRFRLKIQMFIIVLTSIFLIFLLITFLFSFILLKNIENDALSHLKTDSKVFQYVLERLQFESFSNARSIALDSEFNKTLSTKDINKLYEISQNYFSSQKLTFLTVVASNGSVLVRAEDQNNVGDTLKDDPLVKSALSDRQLSTIIKSENHLKPEIHIKSAIPVKELVTNKIIGAVVAGYVIDDAFVDSFKNTTGMDATVFADNKRAATTIIAIDGKSRNVGTLESNKNIINKVLKNGETFVGYSTVFNEPYYSTYTPLISYNGKKIGMIFIGKPQIELLETARSAVNLTFLGSIILMLMSIIPIYLLSRFINEHLQA